MTQNLFSVVKRSLLLGVFCLGYPLQAREHCRYQVDPQSLQVEWTAFKTSEKLAVHGKFMKVRWTGNKSSASLHQAAQAGHLEIDAFSIETDLPARNATLKEFFFKKLVDQNITGRVKTFHKNSLSIHLTLNSQTHEVPAHLVITKDKKFKISGELDLLQFHAQAALDSLNHICHELHKGPDGVSKTWASVLFSVSGKVEEVCQPVSRMRASLHPLQR